MELWWDTFGETFIKWGTWKVQEPLRPDSWTYVNSSPFSWLPHCAQPRGIKHCTLQWGLFQYICIVSQTVRSRRESASSFLIPVLAHCSINICWCPTLIGNTHQHLLMNSEVPAKLYFLTKTSTSCLKGYHLISKHLGYKNPTIMYLEMVCRHLCVFYCQDQLYWERSFVFLRDCSSQSKQEWFFSSKEELQVYL